MRRPDPRIALAHVEAEEDHRVEPAAVRFAICIARPCAEHPVDPRVRPEGSKEAGFAAFAGMTMLPPIRLPDLPLRASFFVAVLQVEMPPEDLGSALIP
jgi:hypothetical protein